MAVRQKFDFTNVMHFLLLIKRTVQSQLYTSSVPASLV